MLRELADLVQREIHQVGLALTDPLTGLPNKRAFLIAAENLVPLAQRRAEPMSVRTSDVVARVSGHEFALLLYSTDELEAGLIVEKIERAIADENLWRESTVALSISLGIARVDDQESVTEVLARADIEMRSARVRQLLR